MRSPRTATALGISLLLHAGLLGLLALHAAQHVEPPPAAVTEVRLLPPPAPAAPAPAPVAPPPPKPLQEEARPRPPRPVKAPVKARRTPPAKPTPAPAVVPSPSPAPTPLPVPAPSARPEPATPTAPAANPPAPPAPPAPPPAPPAPAATGVSIPASYAASNRKPVQPAMSRRYGEEGTVVLRVLVKADGSAGQVEIRKSSGYPMLDDAAREAVQEWRFNPATREGKPVSEWYLVPVTFTLRN